MTGSTVKMTEGAVKMTKCAIWDRSQGHWQGLWGLRASLKEIFPFGQDDRRWGQDDRMCDTGPIVRALAGTMGARHPLKEDLPAVKMTDGYDKRSRRIPRHKKSGPKAASLHCHKRPYQPVISFRPAPMSARLRTVLTPASSSAANFSSAVPLPPETIAPAWPMRLPAGAVTPAI